MQKVTEMDKTKTKISKLYYRYLLAAFGSGLLSTIYGLVDMYVVGKKEGPNALGALAAIAPIWSLLFGLALMFGVGGTVLYASAKAKKDNTEVDANQFFTISMIWSTIFSILFVTIVSIWQKQIFYAFGAENEEVLALALEYITPIQYCFPFYFFSCTISFFIRNDDNPVLPTIAVITGGVFNVVLDFVLTFNVNMGMLGAGLATAISFVVQVLIMLLHFFRKKNTLKLVRIENFFKNSWLVIKHGFPSFFTDISLGVTSLLFNKQINNLFPDTKAQYILAIFGLTGHIMVFVQCLAYSVGGASQPLISSNYAVKQYKRVNQVVMHAVISVAIFSCISVLVPGCFPLQISELFMQTEGSALVPEIQSLAPKFIRQYAISFVFLPFNIFTGYYLQSILKARKAFAIAVVRGLVLPVIFIYALPAANPDLLFYATVCSEGLTFIYTSYVVIKESCRISTLPELSTNN